MANNIDSSLKNTILASKGISVVTPILAPLQAFTLDVSEDSFNPATMSLKVSMAASGSTVNKSTIASPLTDYETTNTTLSAVGVDMELYSISFGLSDEDMSSGRKLEHIYEVNYQTFALELAKTVNALFTTGNFTASYNSTSSAFAASDLKSAYGAIQNPVKNAILDSTLFAKFLPADLNAYDPTKSKAGILGFNYFAESTFTGAGSNVRGFVGAPQAVVVAARLPAVSAQANLIDMQVIDLGGISVLYREWFSTKSQSVFGNFSCVFGASVGDATKGRIIVAS